MVPPFDHPWIIAGQGTAGLEILDQRPDVGAVVVPIGGGGLVAGVAAAIKLSRPEVKVIGVEPEGAAKMKASVDAGHPVTLERTETIADGLMPVRPGDLTFAHVRQFVDRIVTVTDLQIMDAVLWLFSHAKIVAEPSGAATVAAALTAKPRLPAPVVAVVSGGNIGMDQIEELRKLRAALRIHAHRTVRNGADAVDVGEHRRLRHERERREAVDLARARRHGVRPRRVPRSAARVQPVERHRRTARADRCDLSWAPASSRSKSPTARRKRTISWH